MINYKIKKSILNNFFLLGCFLYIVSSINNPFVDINFLSIKNTIITFRGIAPYLLMPTLLVYLFFIEKNLKIDWVYIFFFIYFVGQFFGYIFNPFGYSYHVNNQDQIYWLICNFTTFLYFYTIRNKKKFNIFILKIFIFIIFTIAFKFLYDVYLEFFQKILTKDEINNFYNFITLSPNILFFDQPIPRSSGLSRMIIIIFLFLYAMLFFSERQKYKTIVILILSGFIAFSVFNLQNRVSVAYMIFLFLFSLLYNTSTVSFKKKIVFILTIFIIPFVIHLNLAKITSQKIDIIKSSLKIENLDKENLDKENLDKENLDKTEEEKNISSLNKQRILSLNTSGRKELWQKTINFFFQNNFKGYGPQADRALLDQNVSSLYFYSMLCGGVISLLAIILISVHLLFKSIKMIFIKNIFKSNQLFTCFSILVVGYLYLRSVVEISFGLFGIDMILFFITFNILRNSEKY